MKASRGGRRGMRGAGKWRWAAGWALVLMSISACERDQNPLAAPKSSAQGSPRLLLTADQTEGTVPLTVNFTGTLSGGFDTLVTKVPEVSLAGGASTDADQYMPIPDTLTAARRVYSAREHYFKQGSFKAVLRLHGRGGDILSDTLLITVR
jgi:hypothetical protein